MRSGIISYRRSINVRAWGIKSNRHLTDALHYIDQATGEKLSADVVIKGHENDPYVTESKTINNYTIIVASFL